MKKRECEGKVLVVGVMNSDTKYRLRWSVPTDRGSRYSVQNDEPYFHGFWTFLPLNNGDCPLTQYLT